VLVAVGFFTSPAAFLLSGTMAVAYFQFHQPGGLLPIQNRGELAVLYWFVYLFIAARGTGRFGIDKH
jgi:putative oxidoreductase